MAHEIDFKLYGDDMQFDEIELDGGESVLEELSGNTNLFGRE